MTTKESIIRELGENELVLPVLVNNALAANDRIKYYFTLLQAALAKGLEPYREYSNLRIERETAGITDSQLDTVVHGSSMVSPDTIRIPRVAGIFSEIKQCLDEMILPLKMAATEATERYEERALGLMERIGTAPDDLVRKSVILDITSGDPEENDSVHLLVIDLHQALNRLQSQLSGETVDGAITYLLQPGDHDIIRAFMAGVNRNAPLKFGHPGLGTTATRTGRKIVIQNDIGMTDAHVLVINVTDEEVSVIYTDIHMPRVQFFHSLFPPGTIRWEDTLSRKGAEDFEKKMYHLSVGRYHARDREDLLGFAEFLGSRLVFLIDWNRARKKMRNFLPNRDSVAVLKWAADHNYGHMAFLLVGGEQLIYEALQFAAGVPIRYGEPLYQILGREKTVEYFQWVMKTAASGLVAGQSHQLIQDEIRTELLRYFRSAHEDLITICEDHATYTIEVAMVARDSLLHIRRRMNGEFVTRNAKRAKIWESRADALVNEVRKISRRIEEGGFFEELMHTSDDALDYLEEACYFITLVPGISSSRGVSEELVTMAEIAVRSCQEYLRALMASRYLHRSYSREELQDFLLAIDRVVGLERECDEELRKAQKSILMETTDYKELWLFSEIARTVEESTNSMMKAAFLLRDAMLEQMSRRG
ncbi:uncharacterized protein Yka (UPF0111/DUF47 family) [Methanolinea mesophila]|uniref:hypothetical protein n=1 Tax=Methanolinea mesophila TaxID=547055 RepID=UPI001AEAF3B8|nr:hypothetical protein [Methanolinea mesophila]MBP1929318.1 uncharacterized protein Yka (UPF0111/DUF47 family) [Methanolinea mesophila]